MNGYRMVGPLFKTILKINDDPDSAVSDNNSSSIVTITTHTKFYLFERYETLHNIRHIYDVSHPTCDFISLRLNQDKLTLYHNALQYNI